MTLPPSRHTDDVSHDLVRLLRRLADDGGDDGLTLHQIRDRLDERAYGLLILILTLPCLVPGLYGVPQVAGVIIIMLAAQLLVGRVEPWLPERILKLRARGVWLRGMANFAEARLGWIDRLSRPRLLMFATGAGEKAVAAFMILATLTIVLPMTNTIPSIALALLSVGLIQRDGLFVVGGAMVATGWLTLLGMLATGLLFGAEWATRFLPA